MSPLVWAEIDLGALAHNVGEARRLAPGAHVCAVVKANAYGHGAAEVARAALEAGAGWLAVARPGEGAALRAAGITEAPILVLGCTPPEETGAIFGHRLTPSVHHLEGARSLSEAAAARKKRLAVHVKVDTGMGRLGFPWDGGAQILQAARLPGLVIEGIYTHLASADAADKAFARNQLERFARCCRELEREGLFIPFKHAANSAAVIDLPESHFDLVRPGIMLYGALPSEEVSKDRLRLRPVMSFKACVVQVKKVPAGFPVGYGSTYVTPRPTVIATVAAGYADGYSRLLSNRGEVLIRGRRARVVGRVSMDSITVDAGEFPDLQPGEEVLLFGRQGGAELPVEEVARKTGTISYEVFTGITSRVPRLYIP
jgi:alanine racemase